MGLNNFAFKIFVTGILFLFLLLGCKNTVNNNYAELVFTSNRTGNYEIYVSDANGDNVRRLTYTPQIEERFPQFSPDEKKIGYIGEKGRNLDFFVMDIDGSDKNNIMPGAARESAFSFSPDSKKVGIVSNRGGDFEVFLANIDGSQLKQITHNNVFDGGPLFSLDGRYLFIASAQNSDKGTEIYRIDLETGGRLRYTNNAVEDGLDYSSADGNWFAASSMRDDNWEILLLSKTGKKITRFTDNNTYDARAVFAPQGYKLIWTANPKKVMDVLVGDMREPLKAVNLTKGKGENLWPDWSPDGKRIVFESNRSGKWQIYTINQNGSGLRKITKGNYDNRLPDWRPKQRSKPKILYVSENNHQQDVFSIDAAGSNRKKLTASDADESAAVISPDGEKIAYVHKKGSDSEIYLMNKDGSEKINLTKNKSKDDAPMFSSDGKYISFGSNRSGRWQIYVMKTDGSGLRRLTNHSYDDFAPATFSPDDSKLIFKSHNLEPSPHLELSIVNFDGTDRRKLTLRDQGEEDEGWFSDSKSILFAGRTGSSWQIFTINADGTGLKQLTKGQLHHYRSFLSPDNNKIAYTLVQKKGDHERWDLWEMNADGSNKKPLTKTKEWMESGSVFSPDGSKILYSAAKEHSSQWKVFVMNADGSSKKQLTFGSTNEWYPTWFPR